MSTALALLSDRHLHKLVDAAATVGSGIGGTSLLLEIEGRQVFVKRVPLTDLESRPDNIMSTANVFGLPTFYHYGIGSAGAGVWREVAAHTMTTNWVLGKQCESFPLMYHWRVLSGPPSRAPRPEDRSELERTVAYWDGSPAVRGRLEAIAQSSASVLLFCEYVPQNLHEWLTAQVTLGGDAADSAIAMVERSLRTDVSFMNANGLLHFDPHFKNILTDGLRLYLSDFGLATSARFELSAEESSFVRQNSSHDGCYTMTELVNWLVTALTGARIWADRLEVIHRCAGGIDVAGVPASAAAVIRRYAPIAVVMNEFYRALHLESKAVPFPVDAIKQICATTGFEPALPTRVSDPSAEV